MNVSNQKNVTKDGSSSPSTLLTTQAPVINIDKTIQPTATTPDQDAMTYSSSTDSNPSPILYRLRLYDYWLTNFLCLLLVLAIIIASAITFCLTRSPLSFTYFALLKLLPSLRRRIQSFLYPLSQHELTLELARLQTKVDDYEGLVNSLITFLHHFRR